MAHAATAHGSISHIIMDMTGFITRFRSDLRTSALSSSADSASTSSLSSPDRSFMAGALEKTASPGTQGAQVKKMGRVW